MQTATTATRCITWCGWQDCYYNTYGCEIWASGNSD